MGLLTFGAVPEGGVKGPYANVAAALTALRAEASPSDGDIYQLTAGDLYVAHATSSALPFLVPADIAARFTLGALLSTASGDGIIAPADDLTAVTNRGWSTSGITGNGTVTKAVDGAAIFTATGSGDLADLRFDFDETPTSILVYAKISAATGTVDTNSGLYAGNNSKYQRLSWTSGAAGTWDYLLGVNPITAQLGSLTSTTDTYLWSVLDGSSAAALCGMWTADGLTLVHERDDTNAAAVKYIRLRCGHTGGVGATCEWDELAAIALS